MELLNFLKQIPFPVLLVAVLILLVVTLVIAFQYAKHKGLEGIREQVYQLILKRNICIKNQERDSRN